MRMRLHIFTIALDAMPWLACTFARLNRLTDVPWHWVVVEGAAMNVKDTGWMQAQAPRISADGTSEFLDALAYHPRITVLRRARWEGKCQQCNVALEQFIEPGVLMQVDADELWTAEQMRTIVDLFEDDAALSMAQFHCRYYMGPNVVTTDPGKPNEWLRAWRYQPGMRFSTHEPPVLEGNRGKVISRRDTAALGLTFEHHAWTLPKHVAMKERLYGAKYGGAAEGWKRLQQNAEWPADGALMAQAFRGTPVNRLFEP